MASYALRHLPIRRNTLHYCALQMRFTALKLDVASFFPSIHKATLYQILAAKIHPPELLWLTRTLLFHDPTMNLTE